MIITLPWPDKRLSPNARVHWAVKADVKARARDDARKATLADIMPRDRAAIASGANPIPVTVTFYPPDRRHRDDDNMVGSFKALRDGVADGLKVNDRRFRPHYFFEEPERPGRIEVRFSPVSTGGEDSQNTRILLGKNEPERCANTSPGDDINASEVRND